MSKRYSIVQVVSENPITGEQFELALTSSVRRLFGELGLARIHPRIIKFVTKDSVAVISCNREGAEDLQAAVGLLSGTDEANMAAITLHVSGTIKGLKRRQRF